MRNDLSQERLTAYVLGELGEGERAAIEQALADDPDARRTVEELRATAALAEAALGEVPTPKLTEEQRRTIAETAADTPDHGVPDQGRRPVWWYAAAAGLLLFVGGVSLLVFTAGRLRPMSGMVKGGEPAAVTDLSAYDSEDGIVEEGEMEQLREEARDRIDNQLAEQRQELSYEDSDPDSEPEPAFIHDPDHNDQPGHDTEQYDAIVDNPFLDARRNPLSTFSVDVDTASYSNVRRFLRQGALPPAGSVRIEELINYFDYDYDLPTGDNPFAVHVEVAGSPWAAEHRLVRIGLKGWELHRDERPASNLVFLIDVSGSMKPKTKLPLLKQAMRLLVHELGPEDSVAMVVYSGASGLVLDSTACDAAGKRRILDALDRLESGGSTHGSAGIQLAYETAARHYLEGGTNRVVLATDGDFNVGQTSNDELITLIGDRAETGVFLTVLGFGMGNYKDSTLEKIADKGNGNYAYIDNINEAQKVLVDELSATLVTIAKDVKIQVEFNPAEVTAYRLIGYENRVLAAEDFHDDTVDAGEIGAGHSVTALYEVVPAGVDIELPEVDELRYQRPTTASAAAGSGELMTLKLRYKRPDGDTSKLMEYVIEDDDTPYVGASTDFQFAAAVAAFGMLLRDSPHKGTTSYDAVLELADEGIGSDPYDYRAEFLELVRIAKRLSR